MSDTQHRRRPRDSDDQLVIEKGGYRPETAGPADPPARRAHFTGDTGYRPTTDGARTPPTTKPATGSGETPAASKK
jgi:hypothetical protein